MTTVDQKTINYVEELSLSIRALAGAVEKIEKDLKKVKNSLNTLAQLKENIHSLDAIIQANKEQFSVPDTHQSEEGCVEGGFD